MRGQGLGARDSAARDSAPQLAAIAAPPQLAAVAVSDWCIRAMGLRHPRLCRFVSL
ncbi:hypothetical protein [Streptomyces zaomyceticus]|uniref:hypothetical protein n=1 Tax=Streptomyces zaomyceticus TaxID=68286 RepID=UPI003425276F